MKNIINQQKSAAKRSNKPTRRALAVLISTLAAAALNHTAFADAQFTLDTNGSQSSVDSIYFISNGALQALSSSDFIINSNPDNLELTVFLSSTDLSSIINFSEIIYLPPLDNQNPDVAVQFFSLPTLTLDSSINFIIEPFIQDPTHSLSSLPDVNPNNPISPLFIVMNSTPTAVPLPTGVWLFGSAIAGYLGLSRKRK